MKALPEARKIINLGEVEVNVLTVAKQEKFFVKVLQRSVGLCLTLALATLACASDEDKAKRLTAKAVAAVEAQRLDEAIALYRDILDRFPHTDSARHASERITFLSGLAESVSRFPSRTARDLMIATARAVQRYRFREGHYPGSLDDLRPQWLNEVPIDPWGRPLQYERLKNAYRLSCLGADGRRGGEAEATDFVVVNGEFVSDPAGEGSF